MMRLTVLALNDLSRDSRVRRQARTLVRDGWRVTLLGVRSRDMTHGESKEGVRIVRLPVPENAPTKLRFVIFWLLSSIWLLLHPQRAVQACDADTLVPAYLGHGVFCRPLVYDSHELYLDLDVLRNRPVARRFWRLIERLFVPACTGVITVSDAIARTLKTRYHLPSVVVVRNFPASDEAVPRSDALRRLADSPLPKTRFALYQGILNEGRGLEVLVRAFTRVDPPQLLAIVGDGPLRDPLRALAEHLGVSDRVVFLDPVSSIELPSLTSGADLGVHLLEDLSLNHRFALPNKIFAYLHAGLPVVVTDLPELRRLLEPYGCAEFVPSGDIQAAARAISRLLSDDGVRKAAVEGAREAAAIFTWEREKPKYLSVYSAFRTDT
jgi:glycosyltransferase involved in cell wall biosynthesis